MSTPYFVMLWNQKGTMVMPLENENEEVAMFFTMEEAKEAAENSPIGQACGYDIFEMGNGEV